MNISKDLVAASSTPLVLAILAEGDSYGYAILKRVRTPLFAAVLLVFLGTMAWTGRGIGVERNVLIAFDLPLVVVLGLLLYSASARDPRAPPDAFDGMQVALVVSVLVADGVALAAIAARISEFGFTPNRVAALGENVILLVNLAWSAVLYVRFLRGRGSFTALERWQTAYLPVYAIWAAVVVVLFPLVFGYRRRPAKSSAGYPPTQVGPPPFCTRTAPVDRSMT